jgi:hypothetical protein
VADGGRQGFKAARRAHPGTTRSAGEVEDRRSAASILVGGMTTRRRRPRWRRTADKRDELAPLPVPPVRTTPFAMPNYYVDQDQCPLWVKSKHIAAQSSCPLYPRKQTLPSK